MIAFAMFVAITLSGSVQSIQEVLPNYTSISVPGQNRERMPATLVSFASEDGKASEGRLQRPAWFLPALEYELPIEPTSDEQKWSEVRRILGQSEPGQSDGATFPNRATLGAILVYMEPLMQRLIERAQMAERRVKEEVRVERLPHGTVRYGNWSETPTEGHYSGELYFPDMDDPSPFGYVVVSGSGWPITYEYYRPDDDRGSPLCHAVQIGTEEGASMFACRLLGGEIMIEKSDGKWSVVFTREGQRRVAQFPEIDAHRTSDREF